MNGFIDDPSDFQSSSFQKIDEQLRCPICKELFNTAMMISTCSHSFCALCVRRCLSEEQVCPKCRKEAFSNSIIHNYDLDNVVSIWRISRNALLSADQLLNKKQQTPHLAESVVSEPSSSQTSQSLNMEQLRIRENLSTVTTPIVIDDDQSDDFKPSSSLQRISTTSLRRSTRLGSKDTHLSDLSSSQPIPQLPSITTPPIVSQPVTSSTQPIMTQPATNSPNEPLKSTSVVQCPICQQSMKYVVLDRHLDGCTKGDSRIPPSPPLPPSDRSTSAPRPNMQLFSGMTNRKSVHLGRKPGKVVYAIQSDKDMRMILRDLGLPEDGDKAQKIWRHKEYLNLYNANLDSQNPVSADVLIRRLAEMERAYDANRNNQVKRKNTDTEMHNILFCLYHTNLFTFS